MTDIHDFQDRGDAARRAAGIDGTAGDAQDIRHRFIRDNKTGSCLLCGLAEPYRKHTTTARERILRALTEDACMCGGDACGTPEQYVDAFAHELAEQIRAAVPPPAITSGGPYTNGQMFAANVIDPEAEAQR